MMILRKTRLICLGIISALAFGTCYAKEPRNLDLTKAALVQYHDRGEYQKDQAAVIDKAMQYLKTRLKSEKETGKSKKLALVLDIDETSLSNYSDMLNMSFGGTLKQIMDAEANGTDLAIAPTLKLYEYAKANKVAVFFITGRTESYRAATEKNLTNAGFKNWDGLSLKDENYKEKSVSTYKTRARSLVEQQGYEIVLNIGDQQSDLTGGHADKGFKLPNPYYLIP